MYPSTTVFIAIGQLAIVVLVMFSYPLQVFPCRNCLDKVFEARKPLKPITPPDEDESVDEDPDHGSLTEMSTVKHTVLTSAIVAGGFTLAYFVNDLQLGRLLISDS